MKNSYHRLEEQALKSSEGSEKVPSSVAVISMDEDYRCPLYPLEKRLLCQRETADSLEREIQRPLDSVVGHKPKNLILENLT